MSKIDKVETNAPTILKKKLRSTGLRKVASKIDKVLPQHRKVKAQKLSPERGIILNGMPYICSNHVLQRRENFPVLNVQVINRISKKIEQLLQLSTKADGKYKVTFRGAVVVLSKQDGKIVIITAYEYDKLDVHMIKSMQLYKVTDPDEEKGIEYSTELINGYFIPLRRLNSKGRLRKVGQVFMSNEGNGDVRFFEYILERYIIRPDINWLDFATLEDIEWLCTLDFNTNEMLMQQLMKKIEE